MPEVLAVTALSAYPVSTPGPRVRVANFVDPLAAHGITLSYQPALTSHEYSLIASTAGAVRKAGVTMRGVVRQAHACRGASGLVLVHRLAFPAPVPGYDPPRRLDVYDFDDALFLGSALAVNRRFRWLKREAQRWSAYTRRARLVIAGNSYLADHARRLSGAVEVVPSCVDTSRRPAPFEQCSRELTFGWIGSSSTTPYLEPAINAFTAFLGRGRQGRLLLVGASPPIEGPHIENRPWSAATESAVLAEMDVGLMPLPDDPWTRGKCGYKILQYFAAGLPAIASPVGINRTLVGTERGFLPATEAGWVCALEQMAADPAIRREMGESGRALVEREYSYERWAPRLAELLSCLA